MHQQARAAALVEWLHYTFPYGVSMGRGRHAISYEDALKLTEGVPDFHRVLAENAPNLGRGGDRKSEKAKADQASSSLLDRHGRCNGKAVLSEGAPDVHRVLAENAPKGKPGRKAGGQANGSDDAPIFLFKRALSLACGRAARENGRMDAEEEPMRDDRERIRADQPLSPPKRSDGIQAAPEPLSGKEKRRSPKARREARRGPGSRWLSILRGVAVGLAVGVAWAVVIGPATDGPPSILHSLVIYTTGCAITGAIVGAVRRLPVTVGFTAGVLTLTAIAIIVGLWDGWIVLWVEILGGSGLLCGAVIGGVYYFWNSELN
jgi:hypothetical protein